MRIFPVTNHRLSFASSVDLGSNYPGYKYYPPRNDKKKPEPDYSGWRHNNWFRKGTLGALVLWAISSNPTVVEFFKSDDQKILEHARKEYFEDIESLNYSNSMHHLNMFTDVETPNIQKYNFGYILDFKLDGEKDIKLILDAPFSNPDTLSGQIMDNHLSLKNFKAIFPQDNPDEFEIIMYGGANNKSERVFHRDSLGYLSEIVDGEKRIINYDNVEKYEQKLKDLETLEDWKFFTNKNPLWKHINFILLIYLLLNEYSYDKRRAEYENEQNSRFNK